MGNDGWIKLYRSILGTKDWQEKPFTRGKAWIDLLLRANWSDEPITKWERGIKIEAQKGQFICSSIELAERWGWSRGKVGRFLKHLENEQQIRQQKNNKKICISQAVSIINWDKYQSIETINGHQNGTKTDSKRTANPTPLLGIYNIREEVKKEEDIYCAVCDYLNLKAGTKFRPKTAETARHINARLKDGYTLEDFKTVIDKKVSEWKGTDYEKFLRPKTLFTPANFESYLNQQGTTKKDALGNRYHNKNMTMEERGAYAVLEQTDKEGNLL